MLAVIQTHPVQYHAPMYRLLQSQFDIPVTAIYGSDFSVVGYEDKEFGERFAWDSDLLSGYQARFLSRVSQGGGRSVDSISASGLRRTLQRLRPRAVLVMGYTHRFHQVAFLQSWRAGYPILFRGETTDHCRGRTGAKAWVRDQALGWFYQRCAMLLYVGQHSYQHFRRLSCPEEKLVFSPYCVDSSSFACGEQARSRLRQPTRERLGITGDEKVLLFSGKLSPRKGPALLLRAVKELPSSTREHVVTVFLGNGELRESLECLAQSPPSVGTKFLGFQNQTFLSSFYHAADLLVLPSLHSETWGLVVNEALHHGVPCVVSAAVGCAPDLIDPGATGEIFQTGSVQDLASSLERALRLVDAPGIRARCREKVGGYNLDRAAEGLAEAYARVAA